MRGFDASRTRRTAVAAPNLGKRRCGRTYAISRTLGRMVDGCDEERSEKAKSMGYGCNVSNDPEVNEGWMDGRMVGQSGCLSVLHSEWCVCSVFTHGSTPSNRESEMGDARRVALLSAVVKLTRGTRQPASAKEVLVRTFELMRFGQKVKGWGGRQGWWLQCVPDCAECATDRVSPACACASFVVVKVGTC